MPRTARVEFPGAVYHLLEQLARQLEQETEQRTKAAPGSQPGVKLIETRRPDEFKPNLAAFDQVLDSLSVP